MKCLQSVAASWHLERSSVVNRLTSWSYVSLPEEVCEQPRLLELPHHVAAQWQLYSACRENVVTYLQQKQQTEEEADSSERMKEAQCSGDKVRRDQSCAGLQENSKAGVFVKPSQVSWTCGRVGERGSKCGSSQVKREGCWKWRFQVTCDVTRGSERFSLPFPFFPGAKEEKREGQKTDFQFSASVKPQPWGIFTFMPFFYSTHIFFQLYPTLCSLLLPLTSKMWHQWELQGVIHTVA